MPVIPVIAGGAALLSGAGAVVAAGGVAAMTTAAALSAGALIVGGGLTIAGAVTKNKTLSTIGGVLSLGGGIGSAMTGTLTSPLDILTGKATEAASGTSILAGGGGMENLPANTPIGVATTSAGVPNYGGIGDLANETLSTGVNTATSIAAKAGGATETVLDKLTKYDKLLNLAGGVAEGYMEGEKIDAAERQRGLDRQLIANRDATRSTNANARFTVPIAPGAPQPNGMLRAQAPPVLTRAGSPIPTV